ncbi:MAG: anhydro-N-acetylmuramic acid kinase, partial [candidate division KSB1 bacterium]|nr:anhydro-N-acetylmuramic acid kinase [candidate division KSB1 bacterium]
MHPIIKLAKKTDKFVIGLMSGTSMDGIDAALTRIKNFGLDTEVELIHFQMFPYPNALRKRLLEIAESGKTNAAELCQLNFVVGEYFADAAINICRNAHFDLSKIDLIGSHGQTIQHLSNEVSMMNKSIRSTLQIGEPAVIANRLGCVTVGNFRSADIALGGQGAPLVPYVDYILFRSNELNRVILNIGGIANLTVLRRGCSASEVMAFDSGPGNMVIDALVSHFYGLPYDEDG